MKPLLLTVCAILLASAAAAQEGIATSPASDGTEALNIYVPLGFDHILPQGLDHILFILGLLFFRARLAPLGRQIAAFTIAHSLALWLSVLGLWSVPVQIAGPVIAVSIVYVGLDNVLSAGNRSEGLGTPRLLMIFGFGLAHGLGLAAALMAIGLPPGDEIAALTGFNIGVEFGQLAVLALAFGLVWYALKVDRGEGDVTKAQFLYVLLVIGFAALGPLLDGPMFRDAMGAPAPMIFWPLAGLAALCAISATLVDQLGAYRRFTARPASAVIALIGAWWFIERTFL
ncbi:HupE/UreJ family protein [Marivita sp. GX14005]|uniref:HupE/UreJ family protein n=1 Tax=Marivita sp. GX14005 TaxID=2942276 RepID=UPI0020189590|nr:HupE/UreJ family protein [Marivita sp. GX14005]MCL3882650.1 HupE/UreJ family protein [Marivita sp. GX14005]